MIERPSEAKESGSHQGRALAESLRFRTWRDSSLAWIREDNLEKLDVIRSIVVVGSSNSGKTTIVNYIREMLNNHPAFSQAFDIPKRVITRPQRKNDDLEENIFASTSEDFTRETERGIAWERDMGAGRTERYGFVKSDPNKIPIYSANNALLKNRDSIVSSDPSFLDHSLVILVSAPDDARAKRLEKRSPDIVKDKPEEAKMRMEDSAMNQYPNCHVVVHNPEGAQAEVKKILAFVLENILASIKGTV